MAFSVRNVERFVKQHPDLFPDGDAVIRVAIDAAHGDERGILPAGEARMILGAAAEIFIEEITLSGEHIRIAREDFICLGWKQRES